jgi:hypothetical protein
MGRLRTYEARLARLEARIFSIPDPEEEKEEERVLSLYLEVWDREGTLEDIPEKDRDPETREFVSDCALAYLTMVWEGILDGREEALAAAVDFTRLEGVDEDDVAAVRACGAPGPDPPPKLRGKRSLREEDG